MNQLFDPANNDLEKNSHKFNQSPYHDDTCSNVNVIKILGPFQKGRSLSPSNISSLDSAESYGFNESLLNPKLSQTAKHQQRAREHVINKTQPQQLAIQGNNLLNSSHQIQQQQQSRINSNAKRCIKSIFQYFYYKKFEYITTHSEFK